MSNAQSAPPATLDPDKPPVFSTWRRVYAAVLTYLAALIVLLYVLTRLLAF